MKSLRKSLSTPHQYAQAINAAWRASAEAIFEAGRLIAQAKERLEHGQFEKMIAESLPFGASMARKLMAIGTDERLTNRAHVHALPPHWGTLYEIHKLDDETLFARLADRTINPGMERKEAAALRLIERKASIAARTEGGCRIDDLHELVQSGYRAGAILIDPPWKFIVRSDAGEGRSASVHYETQEINKVLVLPIGDLAADHCVLFLWIVDWDSDLLMARSLMSRWGFEHKTTAFTWVKTNPSGEGFHMGQGYWTRANPETCLLATRGHPKRLNADVRQLIVSPVMEHSRKPDEVHERIERLVGGPYLELYARRTRPGWHTWGNEITRDQFMVAAE